MRKFITELLHFNNKRLKIYWKYKIIKSVVLEKNFSYRYLNVYFSSNLGYTVAAFNLSIKLKQNFLFPQIFFKKNVILVFDRCLVVVVSVI